MDERPTNQESSGNDENGKQPGGNKVLLIGIITGVVLANALIAFIIVKAIQPDDPARVEAKAHADSLRNIAEMATAMGATTAETPVEAVVNIAGTDGERYLKAAVIFEYDDKHYPGLGEELQRRMPKFKNILIDFLSKLTLNEITAFDAREKIRKELLKRVNGSLPPNIGQIQNVLLTQFIIQ
jgi:flagellar basal body-associated protein FliL